MSRKYILFDLDGTLTDPKQGICGCVQYALKHFGIEEPDLDKLEPFIGPPLRQSFPQFYGLSPEQTEEAVAKYRERYSVTGLFENEVYAGIPAMLKKLKKAGFHLAVASSKPQEYVERIMEHFHMAKYFESIVGATLDKTRDTKEQVVEEALRQLFRGRKVEKDQVYMVGDRYFDVEGAHAQGIECVGVCYGYGSFEEMVEHHADLIVFTVKELTEVLLRERQNRSLQGPVMVRDILLGLILFVLVSYGVTSLLRGVLPSQGVLVSGLSFLAAGLAIAPIAHGYIRRREKEYYLTHLIPPTVFVYPGFLLLAAGLVIGFNLLVNLTGVGAASASLQQVMESQYSSSFLIGILVYVLISPLAEELFFRGILFTGLREKYGYLAAFLISSILFGVYHGNLIQGLYAFMMGCLMAYSYEYVGSFFAPWILHAFANLLSYCISFGALQSPYFSNWIVCVLAWIMALCMLLFVMQQKGVLKPHVVRIAVEEDSSQENG